MSKAFHVIRDGVVLKFRPEPEGGYTVTVPALAGCLTYAETFEEALTMVDDATAGWLSVPLEEGFEIPEQFAQLAKAS